MIAFFDQFKPLSLKEELHSVLNNEKQMFILVTINDDGSPLLITNTTKEFAKIIIKNEIEK